MTAHSISDLSSIAFPLHGDDEASLAVFQGAGDVPFDIRRVFTVTAEQPVTRGHHAHRECTQLLVAVRGSIEVVCDDGVDKKSIMLESPKDGLVIPPSIWAEQRYVTSGAVLMVLCDLEYDPKDYLRDYDEFISYKEKNN